MPSPVSQLNNLALDQSLSVQLHFCVFVMLHLVKAQKYGRALCAHWSSLNGPVHVKLRVSTLLGLSLLVVSYFRRLAKTL